MRNRLVHSPLSLLTRFPPYASSPPHTTAFNLAHRIRTRACACCAYLSIRGALILTPENLTARLSRVDLPAGFKADNERACKVERRGASRRRSFGRQEIRENRIATNVIHSQFHQISHSFPFPASRRASFSLSLSLPLVGYSLDPLVARRVAQRITLRCVT